MSALGQEETLGEWPTWGEFKPLVFTALDIKRGHRDRPADMLRFPNG